MGTSLKWKQDDIVPKDTFKSLKQVSTDRLDCPEALLEFQMQLAVLITNGVRNGQQQTLLQMATHRNYSDAFVYPFHFWSSMSRQWEYVITLYIDYTSIALSVQQ